MTPHVRTYWTCEFKSSNTLINSTWRWKPAKLSFECRREISAENMEDGRSQAVKSHSFSLCVRRSGSLFSRVISKDRPLWSVYDWNIESGYVCVLNLGEEGMSERLWASVCIWMKYVVAGLYAKCMCAYLQVKNVKYWHALALRDNELVGNLCVCMSVCWVFQCTEPCL